VARRDDGGAIAKIYGPVVATTAISFEVDPPSGDEMAARIAETLREHPWLVCEDDSGVIGYVYAHGFAARAAYAWSVETSVYVHQERRRAGVGRALYHALIPILRRQGYCQAIAGTTLPNASSVGLHEATGFRPVGVYRRVGWKLGAWHDVAMWQLDLRPDDTEPAAPTPFWDLPADFLTDVFTGAVPPVEGGT